MQSQKPPLQIVNCIAFATKKEKSWNDWEVKHPVNALQNLVNSKK